MSQANIPSSGDQNRSVVGFIGLGNMGAPMAANLVGNGDYHVLVTGRSRERARTTIAAGADWRDTPRDLGDACDALILMLPDLPQVEEVLFGTAGVLAARPVNLVVAVMSSVSPTGIRELATRIESETAGAVRLVDAPVSGGTEGAADGTLSIMVGGADADVAAVLPVLTTMGNPVHLGPLGAGDVAKACNQLIVAATMAAIAEASVIAERSGLDIDALLRLLQGGYAGSRVLETKMQRIVDRDYTPTGVARFMVKDLSFAAAAADSTHTTAPLLTTVRDQFTDLVAAGLGDEDLAVIHRFVSEA